MKAGTMKVRMTIPVASPQFSFRYSGSLSGMKLSALNSHLGPSDQMRINAGVLQEATLRSMLRRDEPSGNVRAVYSDLTLAAINKHTGSEAGFATRSCRT